MSALFIILSIILFLLMSLVFARIFFSDAKTLFFLVEIPFFAFILAHIFWYLGMISPKLHIVVLNVFLVLFFLLIGLFTVVLYEQNKDGKQKSQLSKWFFKFAGFVVLFVIAVCIRDIIVNPGQKPEPEDLTRLAIGTAVLFLIILGIFLMALKKRKKGG